MYKLHYADYSTLYFICEVLFCDDGLKNIVNMHRSLICISYILHRKSNAETGSSMQCITVTNKSQFTINVNIKCLLHWTYQRDEMWMCVLPLPRKKVHLRVLTPDNSKSRKQHLIWNEKWLKYDKTDYEYMCNAFGSACWSAISHWKYGTHLCFS